MITKVRRSYLSYLWRLGGLAFALYHGLKHDLDFGARLPWLLLSAVSFILVVNAVMRRNYIELRGDFLYIHNDWFMTDEVKIDQIEKVDTESMPWEKSKMVLKSKWTVGFRYSEVNSGDFKALMSRLNIPVD
jgi:hypothetical protein